jgi:hypothetical protein
VAAVVSVGALVLRATERLGGGAGDKAETRRRGRETAGLHVRSAKSQSASGKASEALGGARVPGPQLSSRTGILVAGRSLLMVIVARSVGDVRRVLDQLVPGASAGLLLIDCALFAACHYSNQQ